VRASVVIVAFNSGESLGRCLRSLDGEADLEVLVVNNGDHGDEITEAEQMDGVTVLSAGRNLGFAGGCNFGAERSSGEALVFLNPDTVAAPGAIQALAVALDDDEIGCAMARLRLLDDPELLNSGGNVVHLSGLSWAGGYRKPAAALDDVREVPYPSGAAMAIRAGLFRELGGFTEELFMYLEDLDLGWRARLRGLHVVVTPAADVYHDYDFSRNPDKLYLIERNRLVFVLSAYSLRLLLIVTPVLLAVDLGLLVLAAREGWLKDKLRAWGWCLQNARWVREHRREMQRLRRVSDREIAQFLSPILDPQMIALSRFVAPANWLMRRYWSAARRML
jgi:GT2 family glycosyltransferase